MASGAVLTAQADLVSLTDSSGGTASDTLAAVTGGGANCENAAKNAIASLAAKYNTLATQYNTLVAELKRRGWMDES